jgi:hypothetical protein
MGRPKRCASRPKPYIVYSPPSTTTTTTEEPFDYSNYLVIPESGISCPEITETVASTTTVEPFYSCKLYGVYGRDCVVKYVDCQDHLEKIFFKCSYEHFICSSGIVPIVLSDFGNYTIIVELGNC